MKFVISVDVVDGYDVVTGVFPEGHGTVRKSYRVDDDLVEWLIRSVSNNDIICVKPDMPDKVLGFDDFITEVPTFSLMKCREKGKITKSMQSISSSTDNLDMFRFIMCNNALCANGYFITNDNREEKYLEIINKRDAKLIKCLESYLDIVDRLYSVSERYEVLNSLLAEIEDSSDVEELEEITKKYSLG